MVVTGGGGGGGVVVAAVAIIDLKSSPQNNLKFLKKPQMVRKWCFKAPKMVPYHVGKKIIVINYPRFPQINLQRS